MQAYAGEIAALGVSVAWTFTALLFASASQRVGSAVVNRMRLLLGLLFVSLTHWVTQGQLLPLDAEPFRWSWLAFSAVVGFVIGDGLLFQAFVLIGPRLSMLVMTLSPVFGVLIAWVVLDESLVVLELAGIALTVGGIALVVARQRNDDDPSAARRLLSLGVLLASGASVAQAIGFVASKVGLEGDFPALSGNVIRLLTASVSIWLFALVRREVTAGFDKFRANPRIFAAIAAGAFTGPYIGVTLSLYAVQRAPVGVAATLMSLSPVLLLPIGKYFFDERIGPAAVAGTLLAFAGTVLLFL